MTNSHPSGIESIDEASLSPLRYSSATYMPYHILDLNNLTHSAAHSPRRRIRYATSMFSSPSDSKSMRQAWGHIAPCHFTPRGTARKQCLGITCLYLLQSNNHKGSASLLNASSNYAHRLLQLLVLHETLRSNKHFVWTTVKRSLTESLVMRKNLYAPLMLIHRLKTIFTNLNPIFRFFFVLGAFRAKPAVSVGSAAANHT